jgi:hypothetical protein
MTRRASLLALASLAAVATMAIATTSASAEGFLPRRPIFVPPGQIVENCNVNPRLGCAVHIQPPTRIVENCNVNPRLGCAVRVEPCPTRTVIRVMVRFHAPCATASLYPRHHVWY